MKFKTWPVVWMIAIPLDYSLDKHSRPSLTLGVGHLHIIIYTLVALLVENMELL